MPKTNFERITVNPNHMGGVTEQEILTDYPDLQFGRHSRASRVNSHRQRTLPRSRVPLRIVGRVGLYYRATRRCSSITMMKVRLARRVSNKALRSSRTETILIKFGLPFILLMMPVTIVTGWLREGFLPGQLLVALPLTLVGLFFLSIAVVEVRDGTLHYRRFLKWTSVERDEIVSSGVWLTGYIRLTHYVYPWGRLFFVLDDDLNLLRSNSRILRYLKREPIPDDDATSIEWSRNPQRLFQLACAGATGVLVSILGEVASSGADSSAEQVLRPLAPTQFPFAWNLLYTVQGHAILFPIVAIVSAFSRSRGTALWFAFVAGIYFVKLVVHFI